MSTEEAFPHMSNVPSFLQREKLDPCLLHHEPGYDDDDATEDGHGAGLPGHAGALVHSLAHLVLHSLLHLNVKEDTWAYAYNNSKLFCLICARLCSFPTDTLTHLDHDL